jgi:uncharacterized UPF0160 family protein
MSLTVSFLPRASPVLPIPPLVVDPPFWSLHAREASSLVAAANFTIALRGVRFSVPLFPNDWIQHHMVQDGNFYEFNDLAYLDQFVPFQSVIFDLGANIGNHAVYWACIRKAERVYAFEPVPSTYEILR